MSHCSKANVSSREQKPKRGRPRKINGENFENFLKSRNPTQPNEKGLPKRPNVWENKKFKAQRNAANGVWKKYRVEPTTPDLLKRRIEAGKKWQKEWWYVPSHIFIDYAYDTEEEFLSKQMRKMVSEYWDIREWLVNEYRKDNWRMVIDRIRNCLTEIFQTKLSQEDRGREIIGEFVVIAVASAIKALNNKLAQKIINLGLEKGINTNDFIVFRLCFFAMVKDWNYYSQLIAEIKFRRVQIQDGYWKSDMHTFITKQLI
jgi:hypothetical protein